jgi:hypothetical protein
MNTHPNEVKLIAEAAASSAVTETLMKLGIDTSNPIKAQREFAVMRELRDLVDDEEFQADLAHLRKWRKAVESAQTTTFLAVIGLLVSGGAAALWIGLKSKIGMP